MKWAFVGALLVTAVVIGYLLYNYYSTIRPAREAKVARDITAHEEIILCLMARITGPVGTTPLLGQLKGLKEAEKNLNIILARLKERGCVVQQNKNHYRATGRGRRVAAILVARKRQRTQS